MQKTNKLRISTHRGHENTDFGKHSRIPFKLSDIDAKSLLVLSFIDIDQFLDTPFRAGKARRVITLETFTSVLGISKNTVRKCLKELEVAGIVQSTYKSKSGTSYISNLLKLHIRYQIVTYSFISRQDLSQSVKAFIIKVIMLGESRISNIRNITALVKETGVARRAINSIMGELNDNGYLLNSPFEKGLQILDVKGIMLDSEEKLMLDHRELKNKIAAYEDFSYFEGTISKLKEENIVLLERIEKLKHGISKNNKEK